MAKARTRTFRMREIDDWALAQAREALVGDADNTAALQLLIDLGVKAGVEKGYWEPYQAPSVEDRLDPARLTAARAAVQDPAPEGGVDVEAQPESDLPTSQPEPEVETGNKKRNNRTPVPAASVTPRDGEPPPDADVALEDPAREVENQPVGPVLFDDGPDLPEGWTPLEPDEYNTTCNSCGISDLRWVGPRQPRGLRRLQNLAGTIHNPGACRRRQGAAKSG